MQKTTKYSERGHITISIPRELVDDIKKIIAKKRYGYDTHTEFCKEAIRLRVQEFQKREEFGKRN